MDGSERLRGRLLTQRIASHSLSQQNKQRQLFNIHTIQHSQGWHSDRLVWGDPALALGRKLGQNAHQTLLGNEFGQLESTEAAVSCRPENASLSIERLAAQSHQHSPAPVLFAQLEHERK